MIYAVGPLNNRLRFKLGKFGNYSGGIVFETYAEASEYIEGLPSYTVFGVDADWNQDTEIPEGSRWRNSRHLIRDAAIIFLE